MCRIIFTSSGITSEMSLKSTVTQIPNLFISVISREITRIICQFLDKVIEKEGIDPILCWLMVIHHGLVMMYSDLTMKKK